MDSNPAVHHRLNCRYAAATKWVEHDIALACKVLDVLRNNVPTLPREIRQAAIMPRLLSLLRFDNRLWQFAA